MPFKVLRMRLNYSQSKLLMNQSQWILLETNTRYFELKICCTQEETALLNSMACRQKKKKYKQGQIELRVT